MIEQEFLSLARYDIEAHDLAYDFVEEVIGHFYFPDSWIKHREYYLGKLGPWLEARARPYKIEAVISELDTLAEMGIKWSDFDQEDFPQPEKPVDA